MSEACSLHGWGTDIPCQLYPTSTRRCCRRWGSCTGAAPAMTLPSSSWCVLAAPLPILSLAWPILCLHLFGASPRPAPRTQLGRAKRWPALDPAPSPHPRSYNTAHPPFRPTPRSCTRPPRHAPGAGQRLCARGARRVHDLQAEERGAGGAHGALGQGRRRCQGKREGAGGAHGVTASAPRQGPCAPPACSLAS